MWGNVALESHLYTLFNTGFNNQKASTIVYLIKWQYFWWFWFSYMFVLYYSIVFNRYLNQTIKFNPRIVTSQKSHGKWGDVLICILPVFWCVNILTNSNSLLKSLEWQTESSSITLRVRGKQWYWSYKFSPEEVTSLIDAPLTIGSGRQLRTLPSKNMRFMTETLSKGTFWRSRGLSEKDSLLFKATNLSEDPNSSEILYVKKPFSPEGVVYTSALSTSKSARTSFIRQSSLKSGFIFKFHRIESPCNYTPKSLQLKLRVPAAVLLGEPHSSFLFEPGFLLPNEALNTNLNSGDTYLLGVLQPSLTFSSRPNNPYGAEAVTHTDRLFRGLDSITLESTKTSLWRSSAKRESVLQLLKNPLRSSTLLKFVEPRNTSEISRRAYMTIKQEVSKSPLVYKASYDIDNLSLHVQEMEGLQKGARTTVNKLRNALYSRNRLLRTTSLLVLPVRTNLTLITNSFDVVHSWFIPGLGIKMDCVPGRSTHHSLYVRTPGFYYGQCAEICGRLHHHMPIKICFLQVEHFFVWWNHFYSNFVDTPRSKWYRLE